MIPGSPLKTIMRKRSEVEQDGKRVELLTLEVLLDIRDILVKQNKKPRKAIKT